MSIWSNVISFALDEAAAAAAYLPSDEAGTLSTQIQVFGVGATGLAAEAEAAAHDLSPTAALIAVGIGVAVAAALPEIATATVVAATLPYLGGILSESALTAIVDGVLSTGVATIAESISLPAVSDALGSIHDDAAGNRANAENPASLADRDLPSFVSTDSGQFHTLNTISPLVIDLSSGHTGVTLTTFNASTTTTFFDMAGDGFARQTAWVSGDTGLLAQDLNSNGKIDSVNELFGSSTVDGFAKLAALDSNLDLKIDHNDSAWSSLVVWTDTNGDGVTQSGELHSLNSLGIASIDLAGVTASTSTIDGNPISHTSTVTFTGGATAAIDDAWFVNSSVNTFYTGDYTLNAETLLLPDLHGFGQIPDLHIAMSQNSDLLSAVEDFSGGFTMGSFADNASLDSAITSILYTWAGVADVDPASRGAYIDARELTFLEKFFGEQYNGMGANPWAYPAQAMDNTYHSLFETLKADLLLQVGAQDLFNGTATYNPWTATLDGALTLDQTAVGHLADDAPSPGAANNAYWISIAQFLDAAKGLTSLTGDENTWLNSAVHA